MQVERARVLDCGQVLAWCSSAGGTDLLADDEPEAEIFDRLAIIRRWLGEPDRRGWERRTG
jgi:hypothetical protein